MTRISHCICGELLASTSLFAQADTTLSLWPQDAARLLDAMIAANANQGAYAVFDMDNTSYQFDIEEFRLP